MTELIVRQINFESCNMLNESFVHNWKKHHHFIKFTKLYHTESINESINNSRVQTEMKPTAALFGRIWLNLFFEELPIHALGLGATSLKCKDKTMMRMTTMMMMMMTM